MIILLHFATKLSLRYEFVKVGRIPDCDMERLRSVIDYLNKNYTSPVYLDTLFRHACMGRTKLSFEIFIWP